MKTIVRTICGAFFAFACGVGIFSCSDISTEQVANTESCVVRFSVSNSEDSSRTALPETLALESLAYELDVKTSDGVAAEGSPWNWDSLAELKGATLLLNAGSWTFSLTASKVEIENEGESENKKLIPVLSGSKVASITSGTSNSISFDLAPLESGVGSIKMSLIGISSAASIQATLCDLTGAAIEAAAMGSEYNAESDGALAQSWTLTAEQVTEPGTVTYSLSNVPKGSYMLVWSFVIGNANPRKIRPVAVVEPGRCSSERYNVSESASGVPKYYSVTYDDGVDDAVIEVLEDPALYAPGATVTVKSAIERANYNFTGWKDVEAGSVYDPAVNAKFNMPARSVTLTAQWQPKEGVKYKVEHYQQIINPVSEEYNEDNYVLFYTDENLTGTAGLNTNATSKGYTGFSPGFTVGANEVADGGIVQQSIYDYGEDVTKCTVIKVYYNRNEHSLTYVGLESGTSAGEGETITVPVSVRAKFEESVPINFAATRTGYTFNKWVRNDGTETTSGTEYLNPALGGGTYALNMFDSDIVLTAVWTPDTTTAYKVEHYKQKLDAAETFNVADYELSDTDNLTGTTADVIIVTPKDYLGFTYIEPSVKYPIRGDGNTVVKVYYTRNTHTVTYNVNMQGNSISVPVDSTSYRYGATVPVSFTTGATTNSMYKIGLRSGYTFLGWSTDNTAETATYTYSPGVETSFDIGDENVTLYAIWKANAVSGGAIEVNPPSYSAVDLGLDWKTSTSGKVTFTANTGNENYTWQTYTWFIDGSPVELTNVTTENQSGTVSYDWDYSEWEADGYNIMLVVTDADSHVYTATMYVTITK